MGDLRLIRGDSAILDVACFAPDGSPANISTSLLWFTIKRTLADLDSAALIAKTSAAGITVVDGPAGLARINIDAADWDAVSAPLRCVWDLQERAASLVTTLARGNVSIEADVTIAH